MTGDRLVLAHGFTQTARSFDTFRRHLIQRHAGLDPVAVDLPGHGDAGALRRDLWGAADHLVERGGSGVYLGYSMGGRVALHAALTHPDRIRGLILIGATAGIVDAAERSERRRADDDLARQIESEGVPRFIDRWLRNPLFAGLTPEAAMVDDRCRNTAAGLASSLRLAGTGTQDPLWDRLHELRMPTLLIVGSEDAKFRDIAERMASGLPDATIEIIPGVGHSAHLEDPAATAAAVAAWLSGSS